MSRVSHLPKSIPSKLLPFKFKVEGSTTGHLYEGNFTVKVPETREMSKLGIELARLNDGVPFELLDSNTRALHNAIAFLMACLTDAPAWFKNTPDDEREEGMYYGLATVDVNVPVEIFRQADQMVKGWYDSLKGQPSEETAGESKAAKA